MRELDAAMLAYLDHHYMDADDDEKQCFHDLLDMPDPELMGLLSGKSPTTSDQTVSNADIQAGDYEKVLEKIRTTLGA